MLAPGAVRLLSLPLVVMGYTPRPSRQPRPIRTGEGHQDLSVTWGTVNEEIQQDERHTHTSGTGSHA